MLTHLSKDKVLKKVIEQVAEPESQKNEDIYFFLLASIASQQLSTKAADTIFGRFLDLFEDRYPHPEKVIGLNPENLRSVGLSRQKGSYIQNVARFHLEEGLQIEKLQAKTDEEVIKYLTQIKGVGNWTVEMILMFPLDRPDVFPLDDQGIQQAIVRLYDLKETGKELKSRLLEIAEKWKPYRTLACRYLWRWKDTIKN